jgi:hydroxymethylpyrimidine/phosphomethylpyrimidine kinase
MAPLCAGHRRDAARQGQADQFIDNVLASPQGAHHRREVRAFEASFVGAGDTLSAALAALLAAGSRAAGRRGRGLAFLDQSLDAGFRPGMGNVVPDRFFWAMPPAEEPPPKRPEPGRPRRRRADP